MDVVGWIKVMMKALKVLVVDISAVVILHNLILNEIIFEKYA